MRSLGVALCRGVAARRQPYPALGCIAVIPHGRGGLGWIAARISVPVPVRPRVVSGERTVDMATRTKGASEAVAFANSALASMLPFGDEADPEAVRRGLLGARSPGAIGGADGHVVWDADSYSFLAEECPPTANPSLWR